MLELPECIVLAKQLNETVQGKEIIKVIAGFSEHKFAFFNGDPNNYENQMKGKKIGKAYAYGPFVEVTIEDKSLLFGDGVNTRYLLDKKEIPQKHQLLIELNDHTFLACTIQMYGAMMLFDKGKIDNPYYLIAKEKPSPLSENFTKEYFLSILDTLKPTTSIKAALATNQNIPGLGNGVLQDILFKAHLNPKTKLKVLTKEQLDLLYHSIIDTLALMSKQGGRDTEKNLFGKNGAYQTYLSKNTLKLPCPKCSSQLVRQAYLGGNIYFCPHCQPIENS